MSSTGGMHDYNKRLIKQTGIDPKVSIFQELQQLDYEVVLNTTIFSSDPHFLKNMEMCLRNRMNYFQNDNKRDKIKLNEMFRPMIGYNRKNCLTFTIPYMKGFPLIHHFNQHESVTSALLLKLAIRIIQGIQNYMYSIENIIVSRKEIFANLSDLTSVCFLLRQAPVKKEEFRLFCSYLDSKVLEREPLLRMNHQLKLNSMFVVLLEVATQTPINFLAWLQARSNKQKQEVHSVKKVQPKIAIIQQYLNFQLQDELTIEQCKEIMKIKPEFYKRVINNKRNSRILKTFSNQMGIDLINIFTKILVYQQVYSWSEITSMLFNRTPVQASNPWLHFANKLWNRLEPYKKKYIIDKQMIRLRLDDSLTERDYQAFLVTIFEIDWEDVLKHSSFQDFMMNKQALTPEAYQFWQKVIKILEPIMEPNKNNQNSSNLIEPCAVIDEVLKMSKANLTKVIKVIGQNQYPHVLVYHRYDSIRKYLSLLK